MNRELIRAVRERALERCEYCHLPQFALPLPFQIDHIIAEQHGGTSVESNLALACPQCNRYKGPNIAGIDPTSFQIAPLYNPRSDVWSEHFHLMGPLVVGKTSTGRATIQTLSMNSEPALRLRLELLSGNISF